MLRLTGPDYFDICGNMETHSAIAALSALAQETRLHVFRLLVQAGGRGLAAGVIAARLGVPAATLSFHLSHLKQAGLVTCRRESRLLIYAASYDAMNGLIAYLTENCCRGAGSAGGSQCAPVGRARNVAPAARGGRRQSSAGVAS